ELLRKSVAVQKQPCVHEQSCPDTDVVLDEQRRGAALTELRSLRSVVARSQRRDSVLIQRHDTAPPVCETVELLFRELVARSRLSGVTGAANVEEPVERAAELVTTVVLGVAEGCPADNQVRLSGIRVLPHGRKLRRVKRGKEPKPRDRLVFVD